MSNIYTSIDLGTDSIKVVVAEKINNKFHVLASVCEKSNGIKNGEIINSKMVIVAVKKAIKNISEMVGTKITKVILAINPNDILMDITVGSIEILYDEEISGDHIIKVIKDSLRGQIKEDYELVTAIPISFNVDDKENISDPKGLHGELLETKVVISSVLKSKIYPILELLKLSGLETLDIAFTSTGDYYAIKDDKLDEKVGVIINIGYDKTDVSIFNKGIQIKSSQIPAGSKHVDNDLSYIFKINQHEAKELKETFAVGLSTYADQNDTKEVKTVKGELKEVNQLGVSKVVEARVLEILKLTKNEINNLTNREISYIIVTGGLSEMIGFGYALEKSLGFKAELMKSNNMGARHNKFSSALGLIKYFDDKLTLRGKTCNMFNEVEKDNITARATKTVASENNIVSKMFGHFFDN